MVLTRSQLCSKCPSPGTKSLFHGLLKWLLCQKLAPPCHAMRSLQQTCVFIYRVFQIPLLVHQCRPTTRQYGSNLISNSFHVHLANIQHAQCRIQLVQVVHSCQVPHKVSPPPRKIGFISTIFSRTSVLPKRTNSSLVFDKVRHMYN